MFPPATLLRASPGASCRVANTTYAVGGRVSTRPRQPTGGCWGLWNFSSPSRLTMTLPLLDRAFDVIFMVAGDNKAGIVHKFS
jgi:hypothetical protein